MTTETTETRTIENERERRLMDGMELAWGIIANASGGDWTKQSPEWQEAAARWRDDHWQRALNGHGYPPR